MNPDTTTFTLTKSQLVALSKLQTQGWILHYCDFQHLVGEKAVAVLVEGSQTGIKMYMVVEPDGYTHS
jgi:hypothetical protein